MYFRGLDVGELAEAPETFPVSGDGLRTCFRREAEDEEDGRTGLDEMTIASVAVTVLSVLDVACELAIVQGLVSADGLLAGGPPFGLDCLLLVPVDNFGCIALVDIARACCQGLSGLDGIGGSWSFGGGEEDSRRPAETG